MEIKNVGRYQLIEAKACLTIHSYAMSFISYETMGEKTRKIRNKKSNVQGNETDFRDQCHPKYYFVASRRRYFIWLKRADTEDETEAKAVPTALKCCKGAELIVI
ncbi:hypothetical protein V1477_001523 [Vespula maculifrons]|uniref:Uncharacterized protein n=1 Tax=Vespula maculifrons TaxID=7453 RepID=A0ABD2CYL4_VESMC